MYLYRRTIKFIFLTLLFIFSINNNSFYTKSIDLNGIKVDITSEVTKENTIVGSSIDKEKYSSAEYEKGKKEVKDEYVQIELKIKNNNPYEAANITIKESVNSGFKQVGTNTVGMTLTATTDTESDGAKTYQWFTATNTI